MVILRDRKFINQAANYYDDSVRLTQGKYHGWRDSWDGGPRNGWTNAYDGHSSTPSLAEKQDAKREDNRIKEEVKGQNITKTGYVIDDCIVEDDENFEEEEDLDSEEEEEDLDSEKDSEKDSDEDSEEDSDEDEDGEDWDDGEEAEFDE